MNNGKDKNAFTFSGRSRLAAIALFMTVGAGMAGEMAARDIVYKAAHLDQGKAADATATIDVRENGKSVRKRTLRYRRTITKGRDRTRIDFTFPPDIKGLALLMVEKEDGETDQHLYTPALRRVRRIRGSLKSQEFADTDFSYEDMERQDIDDSDHRLDGEEIVDGKPCYRIVSIKKKHVRSQYARTISWIDRNNFVLHKLDMYGRDGNLVKTLRTTRFDQISGVWTQLDIEMHNHAKNRDTRYSVEKISYDLQLDDNIFTTNALEQ